VIDGFLKSIIDQQKKKGVEDGKLCGGIYWKILRVNLTDKTTREEKLPVEIARDFIGEQGLA